MRKDLLYATWKVVVENHKQDLNAFFTMSSRNRKFEISCCESSKKRFSADTEDHYISKHARITPADHLSFPFSPSIGNRLHTVKQILQVDMYEIVDLKVKIITKSQGKPSVMKNQVSR